MPHSLTKAQSSFFIKNEFFFAIFDLLAPLVDDGVEAGFHIYAAFFCRIFTKKDFLPKEIIFQLEKKNFRQQFNFLENSCIKIQRVEFLSKRHAFLIK